jgi:S-adenosylmethionine hydrolase
MPRAFTRAVTNPAADRALGDPSRQPFVSLTTDFGLRDPSAAICRGVILGIAPSVAVVDISHEVAKFAVTDGALLLWCALPYLPVGVHMAVVDPGVGTARRPLGIEVARGDVLVGPDNGLLMPAAERLGGIRRAHALEAPDYRLPEVSSSFHGRDIFAPAAAHLALGVPLDAFGPALDPSALVPLSFPRAEARAGVLDSAAIYVDTFGNVKLAGETTDLVTALGPLDHGTALVIEGDSGSRAARKGACAARRGAASAAATPFHLLWARTFGAVPRGDPLLYEDSYGRLCLAVNQGSAATTLGVRAGDRLRIRRANGPGSGDPG